jgi:NADH-quinone oxidoreductase subunit M
MVLSGIMCKMGAYGLLRLAALFPLAAQTLVPLLFVLGAINIVYGALLAFRTPDLKAMVAYSSISHMGFILIGVASLNMEGLMGATFQMFTHGLTSSALFLLVGALDERAHTRDLRDFGGLASVTPKFFALMSIAVLGSMGLPGLAGFVSELHTLIGAFERHGFFSGVATIGILITAGYSLRTLSRLFFGPANPRWKSLRDLRTMEVVAAAPLAILIVALGMMPHAALSLLNSTVSHMATLFPG